MGRAVSGELPTTMVCTQPGQVHTVMEPLKDPLKATKRRHSAAFKRKLAQADRAGRRLGRGHRAGARHQCQFAVQVAPRTVQPPGAAQTRHAGRTAARHDRSLATGKRGHRFANASGAGTGDGRHRN